MRILIVVSRYPWPARRGDQMRALQLAGVLAEEHEVTLLTPAPPAGAEPPAGPPFAHRTYRPSRTAAVAGLARSFATGWPLQAGLFRQPDLARRLAELAPAADLAVLQLVRLAPHAGDLGATPFVVDLVDSLALNVERRARYDRAWKRPLLAFEAARLLAAERRLVECSRGAILVCERDRAWLAGRLPAATAAKLSVVPLQVEAGKAESTEADTPPRLVFTGNLGYFVNADAVTHWLATVWPALRAAYPDMRLTVAGARPSPRVRGAVAAAPGAELVDTPPDLAPYLAGAVAAVAPLRAGSGAPVKVLEAWAAGVPVVATPWAAAGAAGRAGMDLLVAATAEEWVSAVGRVLADPALRRRLAAAGRARLAAGHSPPAVRAALGRALSAASSTRGDRPVAPPPDREIVSTRRLDAPREVVFRAFTEPDVLARWWGPQGFTSTFHEFDPRPGGAWRFVMRGPDGAEYPMAKEFVEVAAPERIVLRHHQQGHGFVMTMTFADEGGATLLTWRMRFDSGEEAERVREAVAVANEQNLDRLEEQLATG